MNAFITPALTLAMLLTVSPTFHTALLAAEKQSAPTNTGDTTSELPKTPPKAWLGVYTSPATAVLITQLNLPKGSGLVVEHVSEKSPAAQAGLEPNDILIRFDDQLLVNSDQLKSLVQARDVGDSTTLTLRRQGEERQLKVVLGTRPASASDVDFSQLVDLNKIKELIGEHARLAQDAVRTEWPRIQHAIRSTITSLKDQAVVLKDDSGTITLSRKDGVKHLRAEDPNGHVRFDGSIESEAALDDLPADIRKKVDTMVLPPHVDLDEVRHGLREAKEQIERELQNLRKELEDLRRSLREKSDAPR